MTSYGKTFRQLRIGKGLTLKELADDQVSIGFLSKFETDQSKISVDRLMHLLAKMNVTADEYFYLQHDRYHDSPIPAQWTEMGDANAFTEMTDIFFLSAGLGNRDQWSKLKERARELARRVQQEPTLRNLLGLDYANLLWAIHNGDSDNQFTERAVRYLKQVNDWSIYELVVIGIFIPFLAIDDVQLLMMSAERKLIASQSMMAVAAMHRGFLLTCEFYFMRQEQFDLAKVTLHKMKALHYKRESQGSMGDFAMLIIWCEGWLAYRTGSQRVGQARMRDALAMMRLCEEQSLLDFYDRITSQIIDTDNDHAIRLAALMA